MTDEELLAKVSAARGAAHRARFAEWSKDHRGHSSIVSHTDAWATRGSELMAFADELERRGLALPPCDCPAGAHDWERVTAPSASRGDPMSAVCEAGYRLPPNDDPCEFCGCGPGDRCAKAALAEQKELAALREFVQWVDTWVSHPIGAFSVSALDGLFSNARERITALSAHHSNTGEG